MDSATGSNCANWGILSGLANGGDACSGAGCPGSAFSDNNASWHDARLFMAPLINQAALTRSSSSDKTKCIVTARTLILAQPPWISASPLPPVHCDAPSFPGLLHLPLPAFELPGYCLGQLQRVPARNVQVQLNPDLLRG